ncbi:hypothetical protein GOC51_27955, partial [Sinorhizobium meliloti]|nr:hypothetical protein [Sinorhizobium meliloti]
MSTSVARQGSTRAGIASGDGVIGFLGCLSCHKRNRSSARASAKAAQIGYGHHAADSDEAAPLFRDDCAPGFRDDLAPCLVGSAGDDCCQFIQA